MSIQDEEVREKSFRERSEESRKRKKITGKWILTNAALALLIIIIVLSAKAAFVGKTEKKNTTQNRKKVETTAVPTGTPASAATPEAVGADRWIRKDLDPTKPMVAFTFDDGPYSKVTRRILKAFQKSGGRATFFVVGNRVATYAETLKLTYDQGNQIGSHTYDHSDLSKMSKAKIKKEIDKTNKAVSKVIGCEVTALRPPYGNVSKRMRKNVPVPMYYWSLDSEDWKSRNVKKILKRCQDIRDGDIVLMHDLYPTTAGAVEKLVPKLVKQGFQLVTIDELFYYKKIKTKQGKVYYSGR